jgi:adenosine deaminase
MLRVFPDMRSHNIRRVHEAGLYVTVNFDDPLYFGGYIAWWRVNPVGLSFGANRH